MQHSASPGASSYESSFARTEENSSSLLLSSSFSGTPGVRRLAEALGGRPGMEDEMDYSSTSEGQIFLVGDKALSEGEVALPHQYRVSKRRGNPTTTGLRVGGGGPDVPSAGEEPDTTRHRRGSGKGKSYDINKIDDG